MARHRDSQRCTHREVLTSQHERDGHPRPAALRYGFALGVAAKVVYLKHGKHSFSNTAIEAAAVALALRFVALPNEPRGPCLPPLSSSSPLGVRLEAGQMSHLMRRPFFRLLGRLSFTTYMCHYIVVTGIYQLALLLRLVDFSILPPSLEAGSLP